MPASIVNIFVRRRSPERTSASERSRTVRAPTPPAAAAGAALCLPPFPVASRISAGERTARRGTRESEGKINAKTGEEASKKRELKGPKVPSIGVACLRCLVYLFRLLFNSGRAAKEAGGGLGSTCRSMHGPGVRTLPGVPARAFRVARPSSICSATREQTPTASSSFFPFSFRFGSQFSLPSFLFLLPFLFLGHWDSSFESPSPQSS